MDPWETWLVADFHVDTELLTTVVWLQPFSQFLIHRVVLPSNLQFKEKDFMGDHVKGLAELWVDDFGWSSLVNWLIWLPGFFKYAGERHGNSVTSLRTLRCMSSDPLGLCLFNFIRWSRGSLPFLANVPIESLLRILCIPCHVQLQLCLGFLYLFLTSLGSIPMVLLGHISW